MGSDRVVVHLPPMPQPKDFGLDVQVKNDTPAAERYDNALKVWERVVSDIAILWSGLSLSCSTYLAAPPNLYPAQVGTAYAIPLFGGIFYACSYFGVDVIGRGNSLRGPGLIARRHHG